MSAVASSGGKRRLGVREIAPVEVDRHAGDLPMAGGRVLAARGLDAVAPSPGGRAERLEVRRQPPGRGRAGKAEAERDEVRQMQRTLAQSGAVALAAARRPRRYGRPCRRRHRHRRRHPRRRRCRRNRARRSERGASAPAHLSPLAGRGLCAGGRKASPKGEGEGLSTVAPDRRQPLTRSHRTRVFPSSALRAQVGNSRLACEFGLSPQAGRGGARDADETSLQRAPQIGDQVVGILDADRQADQRRRRCRARRAISAGIEAWVMIAGCSIRLSTPPRLSASVNSCVRSRKRLRAGEVARRARP